MTAQIIETRQQVNKITTRSEQARTIRATEDLRQQIEATRQSINHDLAIRRDLEVNKLINQRQKLFELEDSLNEINKAVMPKRLNSSAGLSEGEKKEIKGLYQSGLYKQKQLADQYGITQSAVSQIVNPNDDQDLV